MNNVFHLILTFAFATGITACGISGGPSLSKVSASSNSSLSSLSISAGALVPSFSSSVKAYSLTVPAGENVLTLGFNADSAASVKVNGAAVSAGASSDINIPIGASVVNVVVTAADGSVTTYVISITRPSGSSNADLTSLALSAGALDPMFATGTINYAVLMSNIPTAFTVTPTSSDVNAQIDLRFNGGSYQRVASGAVSTSLLPNGGANTLEVRVKAEDDTYKTYTVAVTYGLCPAGYYSNGVNACVQVGLGFWSPAADNLRYACTNKPASNARYTSPTAVGAGCPWSCDNGYLTTDGVTCQANANALALICNDDEIAVGLYGRDGAIIDRLGVRCALYPGDGTTGTVRNGPDYGGNGGSAFNISGTNDCPAGSVLYEVDGFLALYSGAPRTGRVRFRCKSLLSGALSSWSLGGGYWGTQSDRGAFNFHCGATANPFGDYVNGLIIDNAGGAAYTGDTLGITCR